MSLSPLQLCRLGSCTPGRITYAEQVEGKTPDRVIRCSSSEAGGSVQC